MNNSLDNGDDNLEDNVNDNNDAIFDPRKWDFFLKKNWDVVDFKMIMTPFDLIYKSLMLFII